MYYKNTYLQGYVYLSLNVKTYHLAIPKKQKLVFPLSSIAPTFCCYPTFHWVNWQSLVVFQTLC